ncbi:MAG: serine/threonine-protein kinase [candidate division Zixibacteria bacterium]|nr:serine/threonine-protein kinase [candidate division Zixibacteria bacterium]
MGRSQDFPRLFLDEKPLETVRLLGEGAFAEVFLAKWENQNLAVKILKPGHATAVESFKQEFLLGKNLRHPAFVRFFRFGWTEEKTPFYTMEYLRGTELKKLWPKLDFAARKLLCYQLLLGLTLLHKKGLVHRDLKPSNLLTIPRPEARIPLQLKIMDLGLAQSAEPREGESVGGTVDYLAPELIRKEKPDHRADFYACGIILTELFLGRPPFADKDPAVTLARHQEAPLPELPIRAQKEKTFWQSLTNWLAAKNKEERPQTGAEVLARLLEDAALRKKMAGLPESVAEWCRTLLPRFWQQGPPVSGTELSAEVPATVSRAKAELADWRDVEKSSVVPAIGLKIESGLSSAAYPRLSQAELDNWFSASFGASKESVKILWQKTSGEVSLLELELSSWQKQKLLNWNGATWKIEETRLKDVALSPSAQKELLALAATLSDEERQLLARLSLFLDFFKPAEVAQTGICENENLESPLKNLLQSGFLIAKDDDFFFSRPGLREALYYTLKNRKENHRKIWDYFARSGQTADKTRSYEWEHQAAGAEMWEEAARQALAAGEQADAKEDFKTELWYLNRALKWVQKMPAGAEQKKLFLDIHREGGNFFGKQGELERAIAEYSRQLKLAKKLKNTYEEADAYNRLGNHFRQKPDFPKAEKSLKKALKLFLKLAKESEASRAYHNLGATYAHQLRTEEALAHYNKAAEIHRRLGADKNLAVTLNNIGVAHMMADHLQEAVGFLREALQLNRKLDEKEQIALCLNNLGFILAQRGEFDGSKTLLLEALELNRQIGSQKWEVLNLDNLAIVAYRSGNYPEAIRYALLGLELSEKINFKGNHLSLLATLGGSLKAQGQYAKAEKYLAHGLSLVKEIHDLPSEIPLRLERIELALQVNDLPEAEKAAAETSERIKGVSDRSLRARLFMLLAKLAAHRGKTAEMKKNLDEAEKFLSESEYFPERHRLALERFELTGLEDRTEKIEELLSGVRMLSAAPASPILSCEGFFLEAQSAFRFGQWEEARRQAAQALRLAYKLNEPEKIWRLHHFMARLWMEEKNYQKAFGELQSAAQVLNGLKENLGSEENLARYFQDPEKVNLLSEIKNVAEILGN